MTNFTKNFHFPAEWKPQEATWTTMPQNLDTWHHNSIQDAQKEFFDFVNIITKSQNAHVFVNNEKNKEILLKNCEHKNLIPHIALTNDAWCRDYGPDFLIKNNETIVLDWIFNSWGNKYPPFDADNLIPQYISDYLKIPRKAYPIVLEGGSLEVNGKGDMLTTKSCLLNKNRNPNLSVTDIENLLHENYNINRIIWLEEGILGDDTDGHIDDFARFYEDGIILASSNEGPDKVVLENNKAILEKDFEVIDLPLPNKKVVFHDEILPASYLNYIFTNDHVIVPIFHDVNDQQAIDIIQLAFPNKKVVGAYANNIVIGLGGFHCLSKHQPKASGLISL